MISARLLQVDRLMILKPGKKMNIQPKINDTAEYNRPNNFVEATVGLAHCYKRALEAGVRGDDAEIRLWIDASRALKSFFKQYQDLDDKAGFIASLEKSGTKAILAESLLTLKQAAGFVTEWAKRFRELKLKHFDDFQDYHWDIFLDFAVPLTWDWTSDLFIIQHKKSVIIEKLLQRGQKRMLIIEPKAARRKKLKMFLENLEKTENVHIIKSKDEIKRVVSVWIDHPPHVSRVITSKIGEAKDDDLKELEGIQDAAKEGMINAITFDTTIKSHDKTWIENGMGNFESLLKYPHGGCFIDKFKDCPVIIVSPGPSLDKNIEHLNNVKGKALILAVSHALEFLKEKNIVPDIVLHVDPNVNINRYFKGFDFEKVELLVLSATTAPDLFKLPSKNKTWIYANAYFDNWLMELTGIEDYTLWGSCVSVAALKLASEWGCKKVALIGQDLSFPPGKYYAGGTYAPESILEMFKDSENNPQFKLPGYYGGEVITKNDYRVYHGQFQELAKDLKKRCKMKLYNCTEGGADIQGFTNCSLDDFVSKKLNNQDRKKKELFEVNLTKVSSIPFDKAKVRNNIIKTKRHLSEAERLVKAALDKISVPDLDQVESAKLSQLQKKAAKKLKSSMFLKMGLQDALHDISVDEGYEFNQKGYVEKGGEMYKACLEVILWLRGELNKLNLR